jgi:hypothetical protein
MAGSDEDWGRRRSLGAEDRGWSSTSPVLGGRTIERTGDAVRSAPCPRRRGARVSWFSLKMKVDGFSRFGLTTGGYGFVVWRQNHPLGFPGLGLKTGSCGLVIWLAKSPRWFFGLGLKTKWAMVCWLRHKTDGRMKTARDIRWDLAACFAWKQVGLGFPGLASRLVYVRRGWCTWHHHGGHVEMKPKMDGSMRWAASRGWVASRGYVHIPRSFIISSHRTIRVWVLLRLIY